VRLLLQKGAKKESKVDGFSALDFAFVKHDPDTISALLEVQGSASWPGERPPASIPLLSIPDAANWPNETT
jgi:hypothetical protein